MFQHENEARHPNDRRSNSHKLNVIRSIWRAQCSVIYEIDAVFDNESDAYLREEMLISRLKRLHEGGPLTNRAPGGGSLSGASPFSKARHAATLSGVPDDDPETAAFNRFVLAIGAMRSVVFKPMSRFMPRPTQRFPSVTRKPTLRQAIALAATAAANGIVLQPGVSLPRRVEIDGFAGFVENGVSCDILTSGLAQVSAAPDPADEVFVLDATQICCVIDMVGRDRAADLGITSLSGRP